jgi:hypothetical protein
MKPGTEQSGSRALAVAAAVVFCVFWTLSKQASVLLKGFFGDAGSDRFSQTAELGEPHRCVGDGGAGMVKERLS